jgi:hypothetical protein
MPGASEAGGDKHRANVHACFLEYRRIDEHDVGHGEKGREPGAELGRDVRAFRRQCEEAVERVWSRYCR